MIYNLFYSPTGSTEKVSHIIASKLSECLLDGLNGLKTNVKNIELIRREPKFPTLTKDDVCVISVPVYAGRVPKDAIEKIGKIQGNGAKVVIVSVFGNRAIDDALIELFDVVEKCGFMTVAGVEAVGEHSLARIYGKGRPDREDEEVLFAFSQKIANKIRHGWGDKPQIPGNRPYKEAKASPMDLVLDKTCMNCKICAYECPVGAISAKNVALLDTEKCFSCLHCVSVCPVNARHNSEEKTKFFEERLKDRCKERKPNKLYI